MNSVSIKLVIFALMILTSGCSAIHQLTQDGIGQPISKIIDSMGPPSRVVSDGMGGSIYIWERWVNTGYGGGYIWSNRFWTDPKGIIYKWG